MKLTIGLGKMLMILLLIAACKGKSDTEAQDNISEVPKELPTDFVKFYDQFGGDSLFQLDHIVFPLDGERALEDGETKGNTTVKWQKEDWKFQRHFDDMGGSFSQEFINFHGIITDLIQDNTGVYSMTRRFSKIGDEWMLIYYQEMGMH